MTLTPLRRLLPVFVGAIAAVLLSGCTSAPNWYDSAYYKHGALVNPEPASTAPVAGPTN